MGHKIEGLVPMDESTLPALRRIARQYSAETAQSLHGIECIRCTTCNSVKPLPCFCVDSKRYLGIVSLCSACRNRGTGGDHAKSPKGGCWELLHRETFAHGYVTKNHPCYHGIPNLVTRWEWPGRKDKEEPRPGETPELPMPPPEIVQPHPGPVPVPKPKGKLAPRIEDLETATAMVVEVLEMFSRPFHAIILGTADARMDR